MNMSKPKAAYAVLLTSESYAIGVKVLARSLTTVNSAYPLIVLYTPDAVTPKHFDDLKNLGCDLRITERIELSQSTDFIFPNYAETWSKLQVFGLIEFERVVLLDADMLVRKNLDELMTMDMPEGWIAASHACKCNPMGLKHYPADWTPTACAYTNYSKSMNEKTALASGLDYFNSGLLVLTPSLAALNNMTNTLVNLPTLTKYRFPDQDFLNEVYKERWIPLSYKYNALKTLRHCHSNMWDDEEVKIVHYILAKPWNEESFLNDDYELNGNETKTDDKFHLVNSWWFQAYKQMIDSNTRGY